MPNRICSRSLNVTFALIILFTCAGCATVRHPVPLDMVGKVRVDDMSDIRIMTGALDLGSGLRNSALESFRQENKDDYPLDSNGSRIYPILAISGGSANGAYGAGLLKGWSDEGTRPKFKAVTGVSTGAIISPMAFLGKEYDGIMENLYTTMSTKDVMRAKGPLRALFGNSLASNKPLEKQLKKYITDDMIKKVADEHKKGRRLYVGTVYLDAQRFVIWDMGGIACRGNAELFRKVILASASIPMIFPPVYLHVEGDGVSYDEMHVDGGTMAQVFTVHGLFEDKNAAGERAGIGPSDAKGKYYIIRNGYVDPGYKVVKDNLSAIAGQMFDTIMNAEGVDDTYRIYAFLQKSGNDYNLAFIPGDFRPEKRQEFDPEQMRKLFDRGYQDAIKGYKWHKTPPGFDTSASEEPENI